MSMIYDDEVEELVADFISTELPLYVEDEDTTASNLAALIALIREDCTIDNVLDLDLYTDALEDVIYRMDEHRVFLSQAYASHYPTHLGPKNKNIKYAAAPELVRKMVCFAVFGESYWELITPKKFYGEVEFHNACIAHRLLPKYLKPGAAVFIQRMSEDCFQGTEVHADSLEAYKQSIGTPVAVTPYIGI